MQNLRQYTDDCQVYASMPLPDVKQLCMADVSDWLGGSVFDSVRARLRSCGWA